MNLSVANGVEPNVLPYLPYGVTTLEIKLNADGGERYGFIHPIKRADSGKKMYVGYTDESEDFLVLWGGGKETGLEVNRHNFAGRLFLQVLHKGKVLDSPTLTLCFADGEVPIAKIKLVPADQSPNLVSMELKKDERDQRAEISFKGNRVPSYYSRWFPPRPLQNQQIKYHDVEAPRITIKFDFRDSILASNIESNIDIFLDEIKIAQVTGDWRYSWPHVELFSIFGDDRYFVLRLWLYWINAEFSKSYFRSNIDLAGYTEILRGDNSYQGEHMSKNILESFDIECPDIERFDFLIEMKKKKILWMGTDFHYRELWYRIKDTEPFLKARIALPWDAIGQVLSRLTNRLNQPEENYDPMGLLSEILEKPGMEGNLTQEAVYLKDYVVSNIGPHTNLPYQAVGFTRKHIPYNENGKVVTELISSVVTS